MSYLSAKEIAETTGIALRTIQRRATSEGWPYKPNGRGRAYDLAGLPDDVQKKIVKKGALPPDDLPRLAPLAALAAAGAPNDRSAKCGVASSESNKGIAKIVPETINDPRVQRIARILTEARNVPAGQKKAAWTAAVAERHGVARQTIYKWAAKYKRAGLAGLAHTKATRGHARAWSPAALDYWQGLVLKREHRKIAKKALYHVLAVEAERQGWAIGSERSALEHARRFISPPLAALQRGGTRALDNTLPPVLRSYADLAPFEVVVGDQHRWDWWVVDEETGRLIRPEGYYWQDLRTRIIYGGALDRRYDSHLVGLALRLGVYVFGPFKAIYTDNGKPELSRYVTGIMRDMGTLGLRVEAETDLLHKTNSSAEEINPLITRPGALPNHRRAIVRNAKAKMIEGTFDNIQKILRDTIRLPGYCKRLTDGAEEQEIDEAEVARLHTQGRLPTFREFVLAMFQALDHYNRKKPHRGVVKEWPRRPKPKEATPMQALEYCARHEGWERPAMDDLYLQAVDLVFLPKAHRTVDRGRIHFQKEVYEVDGLERLNGERVTFRYDPQALDTLLVFYRGRWVGRAALVEYSSMKDMDLAARKIHEKRKKRRAYEEEFRRITAAVPDVRWQPAQSATQTADKGERSVAERQVLAIEADDRNRADEIAERRRIRGQEEIAAEVAEIEAQGSKLKAQSEKVPERPSYFLKPLDRYEWIVAFEMAGGALDEEDTIFRAGYEATMDAGQKEYFETVRRLGS